MKSYTYLLVVALLIGAIYLAGCTARVPSPSPTPIISKTPTPSPTLMPTATRTDRSTATATREPLPTLPPAEALEKVRELLETNGGCTFPCWWGIEPSRTSFMTVFNQFSPLTTFIAIKKTDDMGSLDAEFRFPVSETNSNQELTITYKVVNGIIQLIEIYPGNINQFRFNQILKDYGDPEEVWVEGLIDPTSSNPFTIFFYYPRKGIIATFWVDATDLGDMLQICPGSISSIILVLWEPNGFESFNDITGKTYGLAYIKKENRSLISLEQATNQTLVEISESNCFETPKKLWPSR